MCNSITRTRNTLKGHLKKAKQNLLSFLLRVGMPYPESGNYWTDKHRNWMDTVSFNNRMLQLSFDTFWQEVKDLEAKIENLDAAIEEIAVEDRRFQPIVRILFALCIKNITKLSCTLNYW